MTDALALDVAVQRFLDDLTPMLTEIYRSIPGQDPAMAARDAVSEAFDLVCACIDADSLATDPELWALLKVFGPRLDSPLLRASPTDLRASRLLKGRSDWLEQPSSMFGILAGVDARDGGDRADRYREDALRVAYLVIALDSHPGRTELQAIERFRLALIAVIGAGQPGSPTDAEHRATTGAAEATDAVVPVAPDDPGPARPLPELMAELDDLVGLEPVKEEVRLVTALLEVGQMRAERDLPALETSRHLIFTGNPGTGKTTVARLLAQIYRTLGVVDKGHLVETDRAGLVAGYVGQTATKVTAVFDRADGGVLLIDEAYALVRGSEQDFGREAIDTIVKLVEDRRERTVVIAAGYPDEMHLFVDANPGLTSRFPRTIQFPDYTTDELTGIFTSMCERAQYHLGEDAVARVRALIDAAPRTKGFGNGRMVRNLFEAAVAQQARRIVEVDDPTDEQLLTLLPVDLPGDLPTDADVIVADAAVADAAEPAEPA